MDYPISKDATVVIDVNAAIEKQASQLRALTKAQDAVNRSSVQLAKLDDSISKLKQIDQMALGAGCPGGAHGQPIPHGADMAGRADAVTKNLNEVRGIIASLLQQNPADTNTR